MAKKPAIEEKAHAQFSASGSERWMNCPGSIALSLKAPPQETSRWAEEGTQAHAVTEFLLKNRVELHIPQAAVRMAQKKYPIDMVEHALTTANYILGRLGERHEEAEFLCETKVDSSSFTCEGQFGTLDAAIVSHFDRLVVIDFKYGAGIAVNPEGESGQGNSQLVYYALALAHKYDYAFEEVELTVIQPRAYHESGDTIRSHTLSIEELEAWIPRFKKSVRRAKRILAEPETAKDNLVSGKWCRFCPAAVICPQIKEAAIKESGAVFDDGYLESVPEVLGTKIERLPELLDAADRLELWIEKIREYAFGVLNKGGKIPGYKLVNKRAHRKWIEGAEDTLTDFGWEDVIYQKPKLITPAQFEKKIGHDPVLKELMKGITVKDTSGVTMVKADDKRSSIRRNIGEEFDL